ncbi:hypothetical protein Pan153_30970 [Gimesia panareensis]|uniref:DUF2947 domain-containing protein n=1 Tax=Gimesia panareensis TaxID=2527978 RepID=A0A518FQ13_9PLAN|nr:DUF2947 family protein [Gimesia panareensis]QDV18439.1 hypothetical protein Pan153_30970 [Gimesia panareensis]
MNQRIKEIPGFFYNDPKISSGDLEGIYKVEENECISLWEKYVSSSKRHFMLLENNEWPSLLVNKECCLYNWQQDWNNNNIKDFKEILLGLEVPIDSTVYFFWMKEIGAKTTWQIFARNWINFLYESEGCIVVVPEHNCSLILSNGWSWFGVINET